MLLCVFGGGIWAVTSYTRRTEVNSLISFSMELFFLVFQHRGTTEPECYWYLHLKNNLNKQKHIKTICVSFCLLHTTCRKWSNKNRNHNLNSWPTWIFPLKNQTNKPNNDKRPRMKIMPPSPQHQTRRDENSRAKRLVRLKKRKRDVSIHREYILRLTGSGGLRR